jgi:polysaccharide biosynthesis protein PslL
MKQKRELWIDIAKGLGIITVVMGHSGNELAHHYFFWFHMPLFFILSGYIFKAHTNTSEFLLWLKKRTKQLLIPYISFAIIITVIKCGTDISKGNLNILSLVKDSIHIVYGGQILKGYYAVFWFITCLFLTQLVFALIVMRFKKIKTQLLIVGIAYLFAHIESKLLAFHNILIPWSADVTLLAIVYYSFGFYTRRLLISIFQRHLTTIVLLIISIMFIVGNHFGIFTYELDLKNHIYNNLLLDLVIPLSFATTICGISYWISKLPIAKIFATLGTMSLSIMYLHVPLNIIGRNLTSNYGLFIFTLIGVIVPVLIHKFVLERFSVTKFLFLGIVPKTNSSLDPVIQKMV